MNGSTLRKSGFALRTFCLCALPCLTSAELSQPARMPSMGATDRQQIVSLAERRPCASLALLGLASVGPEPAGVFYYGGYPTLETVQLTMADAPKERIRQSLGFLHFNPYSLGGTGMVGVRWTLHPIDQRTVLATFEAEILDKSGNPLSPRHLIEPATIAVLSTGPHRILQVLNESALIHD